MNYFTGCKTIEEARKRYRDLCKVNHPDKGGSNAVMSEINRQYANYQLVEQNSYQHQGFNDEQLDRFWQAYYENLVKASASADERQVINLKARIANLENELKDANKRIATQQSRNKRLKAIIKKYHDKYGKIDDKPVD